MLKCLSFWNPLINLYTDKPFATDKPFIKSHVKKKKFKKSISSTNCVIPFQAPYLPTNNRQYPKITRPGLWYNWTTALIQSLKYLSVMLQ